MAAKKNAGLQKAIEAAIESGMSVSDVAKVASDIAKVRSAKSKRVVVKRYAPLYVTAEDPPEGKRSRLCVGRVAENIVSISVNFIDEEKGLAWKPTPPEAKS